MSQAKTVRVAMTETCNAYRHMPATVADLAQLLPKLEEVRRANVQHTIELIGAAAKAGAQVVGLGELFTAPYFALGEISDEIARMWRGLAEDAATGPTVLELCQTARQHGVILVAPVYELDAATGERFNSAVLIDENGLILGKYRKNHIPSGTNDQGTFSETLFYGPGQAALGNDPATNRSNSDHFPVFHTSAGCIGISICYDRHFEGVISTLAKNGAQIVFSPAVTFGQHSRLMWDLEFVVDAARHKLFIAGSNRKGIESPWNQKFFGASFFAGPNGKVPSLECSAGLVMADLNLEELSGAGSSGWDLERDARPEIYG